MKKKFLRGQAEIELLRAIRERDGLSYETLARMIGGISQATTYGWLKRGRRPGQLALPRLRRFLARDERARMMDAVAKAARDAESLHPKRAK